MLIKRQINKKVVMGLIVSVGVICIIVQMTQQIKQKKEEINNSVVESMRTLSTEEEDLIKKFAIDIVDTYPVKGYAMVVLGSNVIANDQHNRYLVEIDTVAVNNKGGSGLYTYYIVVQESTEGQYYSLPFGIEVIKDNVDSLKREIIISTIKVVNGWGSSSEEFEKRWNAVLEEKSSNIIAENPQIKKGSEFSMNAIYYTQSILKYMNQYLIKYQEAIENNDPTLIKEFLLEDKEYYEELCSEMENLEREEIEREITHTEIINISIGSENKIGFVEVKMGIRNYFKEQIINVPYIMKFKIGSKENEPQILQVTQYIGK